MTKLLLACGVVAGPLFLAVSLVLGAMRPSYDPIATPISLLALGEQGWVQTLSFLVCGALLIAFAVGLWRLAAGQPIGSKLGPALTGFVGLGLIAAGVFTTGDQRHELASLALFVAMPVTCFAFAASFRRQRSPGWAWYSLATGMLVAAGVVALIVAFNTSGPLADVAGLIQRATIIVWFGWVTLVALNMLRSGAPDQGPGVQPVAGR
jgi:hypothetical membrane protein